MNQEHIGQGMNYSAENMIDIMVVPDYQFNDVNLKYTFQGINNQLLVASVYFGKDKYGYNIDDNYNNHQVNNGLNEKNQQTGGSLVYSLPAGRKHLLTGKLNYSTFSISSLETNTVTMEEGMHNMPDHTTHAITSLNKVEETGVELTDRFGLLNIGNFEAGIGLQLNYADFEQSNNSDTQLNLGSTSQKGYAFIQSTVSAGKKLTFTPGLRAIYESLSAGFYVEPKLSLSYNITESVKVYAAWGRYHQFLSKLSFVDENRNYSWYWINNDGKNYPVLSSTHYVGGASYKKNDFIFSAEGYFKATSGITRYFSYTENVARGFYSGKGISYGIDLYLKKEYKKNVAWISYTLSKTEENLSFDTSGIYRPAPQDQRHELKIAGIYNLKKWYFSATWVYGSGFEILKNYVPENSSIPAYRRLDAGVVYKFKRRKAFGNIGFSILNVLNQQNIRYDNLKRVETGTDDFANIYSGAIPFSPYVFLKLGI